MFGRCEEKVEWEVFEEWKREREYKRRERNENMGKKKRKNGRYYFSSFS